MGTKTYSRDKWMLLCAEIKLQLFLYSTLEYRYNVHNCEFGRGKTLSVFEVVVSLNADLATFSNSCGVIP